MKRRIFTVLLCACLLAVPLTYGEGLLPTLTNAYGIAMLSLTEALGRYPESEETVDGAAVEYWEDITEDDFNTFGIYLKKAGAILHDYHVENSVFTATIAKGGRTFSFVFDTDAETAAVTYPAGTYDERLFAVKSVWNAAESAETAGRYTEAAEKYESLIRYEGASVCYRDSDQRELRCYYEEGEAKRTAQDWGGAVAAFTKANDYSDAATQIKETRYLQAQSLIESGYYFEARKIFMQITGYKDVDIILDESEEILAAATTTYSATEPGFMSDVTVTVTLDYTRTIKDIAIDASEEIPELGGLVMKEKYTSQFIGKKIPEELSEIDAVAGATITSNAVIKAINKISEMITEKAEDSDIEVSGSADFTMHTEFMAAAIDDEVVVESYVQDHQSWWADKVTVYLQDPGGGYFAYNMACSEEDATKLVPGTKIRVKGYKSEWAGEVEIVDGTFEFVDAEPWIAEPTDVTELVGTDELAAHMNERVVFKGATIVAQDDGEAFNYKNPEKKTDDLFVRAIVNGTVINFCVEYYLRNNETDVYRAVEALNVGDKVDIDGYLYWYLDANPHIIGVEKVQ